MLRRLISSASTLRRGKKLCLLTWVLLICNCTWGQSNCPVPIDLAITSINDSTFALNWSQPLNGSGSVLYESEYREVSSPAWTKADFQYGNDTEHAKMNNAKKGLCYEWRVRAICISPTQEKENSPWSTIFLKTGNVSCPTEPSSPACLPPFDLFTSTSNDTIAELTWAQTLGYSTYYDAEIREVNTTTWHKGIFPYGNDFELCRYKVTQGKCYEWRVRTICLFPSSVRDTTAWSTIILNTGASNCTSSPPTPPAPAPYVNPNFSYSIDPCFPNLVSFSNTTSASGISVMSIEWSLGDNTKTTANNPVHTYSKTGSYEVTLAVTDNSGKIYTKTTTVSISTLIKRFADAGADLTICNTDTVKLKAAGGEVYSWNPCVGLSNCNIADPIVEPGTIANYVVTVRDKDGCIDTDTVMVKYISPAAKIYVPNAFTPNNDGVNDQFRPLLSMQGVTDVQWKIFNRFGNMIFSSNNSLAGWDGKHKGELQPAGNYTYMINLRSTGGCPAQNLKGTVLLIR